MTPANEMWLTAGNPHEDPGWLLGSLLCCPPGQHLGVEHILCNPGTYEAVEIEDPMDTWAGVCGLWVSPLRLCCRQLGVPGLH